MFGNLDLQFSEAIGPFLRAKHSSSTVWWALIQSGTGLPHSKTFGGTTRSRPRLRFGVRHPRAAFVSLTAAFHPRPTLSPSEPESGTRLPHSKTFGGTRRSRPRLRFGVRHPRAAFFSPTAAFHPRPTLSPSEPESGTGLPHSKTFGDTSRSRPRLRFGVRHSRAAFFSVVAMTSCTRVLVDMIFSHAIIPL
jgi:hypothetical protein